MFTKKHYEIVADIISHNHDSIQDEEYGAIQGIFYDFLEHFEEENPNFDKKMFTESCGYEYKE